MTLLSVRECDAKNISGKCKPLSEGTMVREGATKEGTIELRSWLGLVLTLELGFRALTMCRELGHVLSILTTI